MGRNNQARRQQKKRQKQKKQKQKQSSGTRLSSFIPRDEFLGLCDLVTVSLLNGEPPPPKVLESFCTASFTAAAIPLRTLLVGFIDFLFNEEGAKGDFSQLTPHRQMMAQTDLAWLYSLLYAYCLISDQHFVEDGGDTLSMMLENQQFPCDLDYAGDATEALCAPLYLLLYVLGHPSSSSSIWLHAWLKNTSFHRLIPELRKFLGLKRPKPEQKTVQALESALESVELNQQNESLAGISGLLTVFFSQRVTATPKQLITWQQQCPQLSRLGGLVDTPRAPSWSQLDFTETNYSTLNRLNRLVDVSSMPYTEKVSLEALKCRILGAYVCDESVKDDGLSKEAFEHQLEQLIHLLSTGVPTEFAGFAQQCADLSCEWLATEVGARRLPPPARARMRRLIRLRPDDYRVALISFLAADNQKASANPSDNQQVHFPLFFRALDEYSEKSNAKKTALLNGFFWPLTGEAKKALFIQCCKKVFLGMCELEAEKFWAFWLWSLFDSSQDPFNRIISGQGCEAELLFYIAIAAVGTKKDLAWLKADQLAPLVYYAEQLLSKHASDFNQTSVVSLLSSLASHQHASELFQDWAVVTQLLQYIKCQDELEHFLLIAITTLNSQSSIDASIKNSMAQFCWPFPKLRQYLPDPSSPKKNRPSKKEESSPNLDLFGEL